VRRREGGEVGGTGQRAPIRPGGGIREVACVRDATSLRDGGLREAPARRSPLGGGRCDGLVGGEVSAPRHRRPPPWSASAGRARTGRCPAPPAGRRWRPPASRPCRRHRLTASQPVEDGPTPLDEVVLGIGHRCMLPASARGCKQPSTSGREAACPALAASRRCSTWNRGRSSARGCSTWNILGFRRRRPGRAPGPVDPLFHVEQSEERTFPRDAGTAGEPLRAARRLHERLVGASAPPAPPGHQAEEGQTVHRPAVPILGRLADHQHAAHRSRVPRTRPPRPGARSCGPPRRRRARAAGPARHPRPAGGGSRPDRSDPAPPPPPPARRTGVRRHRAAPCARPVGQRRAPGPARHRPRRGPRPAPAPVAARRGTRGRARPGRRWVPAPAGPEPGRPRAPGAPGWSTLRIDADLVEARRAGGRPLRTAPRLVSI
jgi:hypothetical protein